jgi:hypothetical protein
MYHPSIFDKIPNEPGVYVLRRKIDRPSGSQTAGIERVAVVGSSKGVKKRLQQYFVELTASVLHPNVRNAASLLLDSITHVDVYYGGPLTGDVEAQAGEHILTEQLEPMLRTPKGRDNISPDAIAKAKDSTFSMQFLGVSPATIELPNIDNMRRWLDEMRMQNKTLLSDIQALVARVEQLERRQS